MNELIIKWFKLLIVWLNYNINNIKKGQEKINYSYKLNTIEKALKIIMSFDKEITNGEQLRHFKGIGDGIVSRINEILDKGVLSEVDISVKNLEYVDSLTKVFGIGKIKAYELVTKYGITSVDDLKKHLDILPENIIKGLKYVDKINDSVPRKEMDEIYFYLNSLAGYLDKKINIEMCCSYRRESDYSGDIDIIISSKDDDKTILKKFIDLLIDEKFIVESFTSDNVSTKYMGLCKIDKFIRRIDIRFIKMKSLYTAKLYFTGSKNFNQQMRGIAKSLGYRLNEYSLRYLKDNKRIKINSEKDVFDILGMEYVLPKDR